MFKDDLERRNSASQSSASASGVSSESNSPSLGGNEKGRRPSGVSDGKIQMNSTRREGGDRGKEEVVDSNSGATLLRPKKKFYEFYTAPITKFWSWTFAYFFFLVVFTYTLIIRTPEKPEWNE